MVLRVFAPLIAPYGFDQYTADGTPLPEQGSPGRTRTTGWHDGRRLRRAVARDLRRADRARGHRARRRLLARVGVPLGLISGYFGGWLDRVLVLIMDALFAFPYLLLAIVIAVPARRTASGSGVVDGGDRDHRRLRAAVLPRRARQHAERAGGDLRRGRPRARCAAPRTIIARYLFSNVVQTVPVIATLNAADAILTLAGLGFLGFGIQPTEAAEWGYDLQRGDRRRRRRHLVDRRSSRACHRAARDRPDAGRRGPQRRPQPVAPPPRRHRRRSCASRDRRPAVTRVGTGERHAAMPTGRLGRDLRVWYGTARGPVRAVDGVDLDSRPGETLGLVGESGCGKSTLGPRRCSACCRTARGSTGAVDVQGQDLVTHGPSDACARCAAPELGLIFQEPMTRLDPLMKISDHFDELLRTHEPRLGRRGRPRPRAGGAARAWASRRRRYHQYPHEFSGGMRQRIMIALALVLKPALIVADEPTTALDVLVEAQILRILADLRRNFDTALLLITHNLGIVAEACDRVAVMYAGRIVEEGPSPTVFRQAGAPLHARAAALDDLALDHGAALHPRRAARPGRPAGRAAASTRAARTRCGSAPARHPGRGTRRAPASGSSAGCTGWTSCPTIERQPMERAGVGRCRRSLTRPAARVRATPRQRRAAVPAGPRPAGALRAARWPVRRGCSAAAAASVKAVDGVSFDLRRGEVLGLVGESRLGQDDARPRAARARRGRPAAASARSGAEIVGQRASASCGRCGGACRWSSRTRTPSLNPAMDIATAVAHPLKIHKLDRAAASRPAPGCRAALERVGPRPGRAVPAQATRRTSRAGRSSAPCSPARSSSSPSCWSPTSRSRCST